MKFIKNIFIVLFVVVFITGCGNNAPKNENGTKYDYEATNPYENVVEGNPTFVSAKDDETHKGVIYLDPTNLNRLCTKEDAEKNINTNGTPTLIKRGCMKWYVINDKGNDYTLLLDHNTEVTSYWYEGEKDGKITYEDSDLKKVVEKLVTDYNWKANPRLISVDEILNIVDGNNWSSNNDIGGIYFDSGTSKEPTSFESGHSKYDWLFNNTYGCGYRKDSKVDGVNINYGCTIEDNNFYKEYSYSYTVISGYWTSTLDNLAVYTITDGTFKTEAKNSNDYGIRPVITISKSVINGNNNNNKDQETKSGLKLNKYYVSDVEPNVKEQLNKSKVWLHYLKFINDKEVEINFTITGEDMDVIKTKYETYFEDNKEYIKIYPNKEKNMYFMCASFDNKEYALLRIDNGKLQIITDEENYEGLDMSGVRTYAPFDK